MLSAHGLAWDGGVTEGGSRYTCQGVGLGSGVTGVSSPPVMLWVLPRPLQVAREGRETEQGPRGQTGHHVVAECPWEVSDPPESPDLSECTPSTMSWGC